MGAGLLWCRSTGRAAAASGRLARMTSRPAGLYTDPDRPPAAERRLVGWPRPPLDGLLDAVVPDTIDEPGEQWPPPEWSDRTAALAYYDLLWAGDISAHVEAPEQGAVMTNWFRRVLQVQSAILTSTGPVGHEAAASQLLSNVARYGSAYLVRDGEGRLWSPLSSESWETEGGRLVVCRPIRSRKGRDDRLEFWSFSPDGTGSWRLVEARGRNIGLTLDEMSFSGAMWERMDRPPAIPGRWGESQLDDMVPMVVTIALRQTGVNDVLTANEAPTTVVPASDDDIGNAVRGDPSQPAELVELGRRQAQEELVAMRGHNQVWAADGIRQGYVLEWSGNLGASLDYLDHLSSQMGMLTGVKAALSGDSGNVPSGKALQESRFVSLGATTRELRRQAHTLLNRFAGAMLDWPDPFTPSPDDPGDGGGDDDMELGRLLGMRR